MTTGSGGESERQLALVRQMYESGETPAAAAPPRPMFAVAWLDDRLRVVAEAGLGALAGRDPVGSTWSSLLHEDDRTEEEARSAAAGSDGGWAGVGRVAGSRTSWVQFQVEPVGSALVPTPAVPVGAEGVSRVVCLSVVDHWVATHDALVEAEARVSALAGELPVALVELSPDGRVTLGNPALADLLGTEPVGRWLAQLVPPEHLTRVFGVIAAALGADEPFVTEFPITRPDGSIRWVRATGHSRRRTDGEWASVAGTWTDITGELEIRSAAERFMEALDSVDDLIAITDGAGSITYLNGTGRAIFGHGAADAQLEPGALPVAHLLALMEPAETGAFLTGVATVIAERGSWTGELALATPRGRRTYSVLITPHTSDLDGRLSVLIVARDITTLKDAEEVLRERASRDALTGLANRSTFLDALGDELRRRRADPDHVPLAVLFVDLDRFKPVNDDHGHAVGDQVLAVVGARLGGSTRDDDLVARFGGDEFVVLCRGAVEPDDAAQVAERMVDELTRPVVLDNGLSVAVGASVGVAMAQRDDEADQLIARADRALRTAKDAGRGAVVIAR